MSFIWVGMWKPGFKFYSSLKHTDSPVLCCLPLCSKRGQKWRQLKVGRRKHQFAYPIWGPSSFYGFTQICAPYLDGTEPRIPMLDDKAWKSDRIWHGLCCCPCPSRAIQFAPSAISRTLPHHSAWDSLLVVLHIHPFGMEIQHYLVLTSPPESFRSQPPWHALWHFCSSHYQGS